MIATRKPLRDATLLHVQLVRKCYSKAERAASNCTGDHWYKKKKLSRAGMHAVQSATFSFFPVKSGGSEEEAWKLFKIAIGASCHL